MFSTSFKLGGAALFGLLAALSPCSALADRCTSAADTAPWADLMSARPSALVQQGVIDRDPTIKFQHIEDSLNHDLNVDSYTVTISTLPTVNGSKMNGADLVFYVRTNFATFLDASVVSSFTAYNADQDGQAWASASPLGALMSFQIILFQPVMVGASVLTYEADSHHWAFTTMYTPNDHRHPVSGNRWFGVNSDTEPVTFTIRGADRPFWWTAGDLGGFANADRLWTSFQTNLVNFVTAHQGSAIANPRLWIQCSWGDVQPLYFNPTIPWVVPIGANPSQA